MTFATNRKRRVLLKSMGAAAVAVPLGWLLGCEEDVVDDEVIDEVSDPEEEDDATDSTDSTDAIAWAVGGTELISVAYPATSLFDAASVCTVALAGQTTEGPCYFSVAEREDISDGRTGLPMMLCLRLIDSACNPLSGYTIEVWHCDTAGVYSADTSDSDDSGRFAGNFCTGGSQEAQQSTWYRGELVTDSEGRVNFKSCFPGWYSGRTIHIHFRVKQGNYDSVISQFCFSDEFCEEICTTHAEYSARGSQNTPLSSGRDTVFGADYEDYQLSIQQNSDGTLLAYGNIQIN